LMAADLDLQIGRVQTFFLWKYLILSQFLILKTPTELPYHAISAEISFDSTCMSTIKDYSSESITFYGTSNSWKFSYLRWEWGRLKFPQ
jgi:hypothetical protein